MALLAGIDEAGYGPHLGPLVVAAAAFDLPRGALPDPDLWEALRLHVRKEPTGADPRVIVCDSKLAYAPARGLANLERTVLGFLAATGARPRTFAELLAATSVTTAAPGGADAGLPEPWHHPDTAALPAAVAVQEIEAAAGCFDAALGTLGGRAGKLWVNVATAARLNRLMLEGRRNKAAALFALNADLLVEIRAYRPMEPIHVTVDRHGGRRFYGNLLAGALPMHTVETLEESAEISRYRLQEDLDEPGGRRPAAPMDLTIRDRCETWSLPTALASMAAKYVRELHMHQLNLFFTERVPGLRPTAGYGRDAWRFLEDVAAARAAVGVPDDAILRTR